MANNLQNQIRQIVDSFASDLEAVIRRSALEAVSQALGSSTSTSSPRQQNGRAAVSAPRAAAPARPAAAASAPKRASGGGKRIRRSPAQIETIANTIVDYIAKNPNLRAEQIKGALKLRTNDWALPVKKLLDEGRLTATGEKRATTYVVKGGRGK